MNITIEWATVEDMQATQEAHIKSIQKICCKDYSAEQIRVWSDVQYTSEHFNKSITQDFYKVVRHKKSIHGFIHAGVHSDGKTGEIYGFYLTTALKGQGVGRRMIELALDHLKSKTLERIILSATLTAKPFYEHMGFKATGPMETECVRGASIECYKMEMVL